MSKIRRFLSKQYHKIENLCDGISYYYCDFRYFLKESNLGGKGDTEARKRASLIANYHIIEKGLSMPNRRLGFGRDRLLSLITMCENYYKVYGMHSQLRYAISIIKEYDELHKRESFRLDDVLQAEIDALLKFSPDIKEANQMTFTKETFFAHTLSSFDKFSESRHSMRHFTGAVPINSIEKAVELAKNAPSACNKQPVRLHVVYEKDTVAEVLDLQQGNRGFGQNIDKVIIVTTQFTGCTRFSERYMPFIDAGIFSMNLLYALHFNRVGAIPLVWLNSKERDEKLREIVLIPREEIPSLIIGVGDVTDSIVCAQSPRLNVKDIINIR